MEKENLLGQMVLIMKEIFNSTTLKDLGFIYGQIKENMKGLGNKIKWMAQVK